MWSLGSLEDPGYFCDKHLKSCSYNGQLSLRPFV